jgi:hypothetical protein
LFVDGCGLAKMMRAMKGVMPRSRLRSAGAPVEMLCARQGRAERG